MGVWDSKGNVICGCGNMFIGATRREDTVQMLRARGWNYSVGQTQGGQDYEAVLCPSCARNEHKRVVSKPTIQQDDLPFDWEALRVSKESGGSHTR